MASSQQIAWLKAMFLAAKTAGHKWPQAAACEAAVETGWGQHLPPNSNNVLGIKAYRGWTGPTVGANGTEENKDGSWTGPQPDQWCVFDSPKACFFEQTLILQEPRYMAAMEAATMEGYEAPDPDDPEKTVYIPGYIELECAVWSTGQAKGQAVLQTYNAHKGDLQ